MAIQWARINSEGYEVGGVVAEIYADDPLFAMPPEAAAAWVSYDTEDYPDLAEWWEYDGSGIFTEPPGPVVDWESGFQAAQGYIYRKLSRYADPTMGAMIVDYIRANNEDSEITPITHAWLTFIDAVLEEGVLNFEEPDFTSISIPTTTFFDVVEEISER